MVDCARSSNWQQNVDDVKMCTIVRRRFLPSRRPCSTCTVQYCHQFHSFSYFRLNETACCNSCRWNETHVFLTEIKRRTDAMIKFRNEINAKRSAMNWKHREFLVYTLFICFSRFIWMILCVFSCTSVRFTDSSPTSTRAPSNSKSIRISHRMQWIELDYIFTAK